MRRMMDSAGALQWAVDMQKLLQMHPWLTVEIIISVLVLQITGQYFTLKIASPHNSVKPGVLVALEKVFLAVTEQVLSLSLKPRMLQVQCLEQQAMLP